MTLECLCGSVRVVTDLKPDYVNACNCDLCRKVGATWGYFAPSHVTVEGPTSSHRRVDRAEPGVDVHFCAKCGATTHFRLTEHAIAKHGEVMLGVNIGLANEADLYGIEVRYPDGKAWAGEGEFTYVRPSRRIGLDS